MRRIVLDLDDEDARRLEAQIDASRATLEEVARDLLAESSQGAQRGLACSCGQLERLSSETGSPVIFDGLTNEFALTRDTPHGKGKYVIRHCFWCGGRAPESKRDQLFAIVDFQEVQRLKELCAGIRTFDDAIGRFGPPTFDRPAGAVMTMPTPDGAEEHTAHRVISYGSLSDLADVLFTQRVGDLVSVSFVGKYIGPLVRP